jgi:predicted transcriptional regulator
MDQRTLVELTADIVASQVANNATPLGDVSRLVETVHRALSGLGDSAPQQAQPRTPAVSVKASVKPDFIACLECGKKQKMLRRHLRTAHGMAPDDYRSAFGLSPTYPMVASNYVSVRREIAIANGLGRKPG